MQDLKKLYENLGLAEVSTYIQSGNVLFKTTQTDQQLLATQISAKIAEVYAFQVEVVVLTLVELEKAINQNPFAADSSKTERTYFTFLAAIPAPDLVTALLANNYAPEELHCIEKVAYFYSPADYGKAVMSNNFIEKKLKVVATTRNYKTTLHLKNLLLNV